MFVEWVFRRYWASPQTVLNDVYETSCPNVHILVSLSLLSIFGHCPLVKFLEKSDRVTGDVHNSSLLSLLFSSQLPTFACWIWKKKAWQSDSVTEGVHMSVTLSLLSIFLLTIYFKILEKRVTEWQGVYTFWAYCHSCSLPKIEKTSKSDRPTDICVIYLF